LDEKGSIMEQYSPSSLTAQHKTLAQGTLLTTVKWPDLVPSWSRCWPEKAWSWSTDTIRTPISLIRIHIMHNWGLRPKRIPSEAGDITKLMVMWLILTRVWMTILELIWGRFCNGYAAWCCINLFRSLKILLYYHWMKKDQLWSNLPPQVWPRSIKPLHQVPYLPWSNGPIWCQVGVNVGLKRHDPGPRIPSEHL